MVPNDGRLTTIRTIDKRDIVYVFNRSFCRRKRTRIRARIRESKRKRNAANRKKALDAPTRRFRFQKQYAYRSRKQCLHAIIRVAGAFRRFLPLVAFLVSRTFTNVYAREY